MAYIGAQWILMMLATTYAQTGVEKLILEAREQAPRIFLKAPERASKDGFVMETHHVLSEDGYITGLHRIPGRKPSLPVLITHSMAVMSDVWIAFGHNHSLAYDLAENGFDVWLGNARGNLYSKNHTILKSSDSAFWKFSWHEMGVYDLTAMIDFILNETGHKELIYIAHSMGNNMVFVMLSLQPEYNSKLRLVICLSPAIFISHTTSRFAIAVLKNRSILKKYIDTVSSEVLLPYSQALVAMSFYLYQSGTLIQRTVQNILQEICGISDGLDNTDLPVLLALESGVSVNTLWHYLQLIQSGKFQQFDFGPAENQRRYGAPEPPEYNLKRITVPVAIQYGDTDTLVPAKDVQYLSMLLPNVVELRRVPSKYFNHLDFVTHRKVKELLNDHIVDLVKRYQ